MARRKLETQRKTRPYSIRFDVELEEFLKQQDNLSELVNRLLKEEKERVEKMTNKERRKNEEDI